MPDHSSDTPVRARAPSVDTVAGSIGVETSTVGSPAPRRSRRARRTDWRLGGRTVRTWREGLLAVALVALGLGMLAGVGAQQLGAPPVVGTALPWAGMLVAIVIAFTRSRPVGLLRVRPIDLLWAVGLGLALRLAEGWLQAASGDATLPSLTTVDGHLPGGWWVDGVLAPVLVAPAIEELFFHAVVLVSLYSVLRRPFGGLAAGIAALLVWSAFFVAVHALVGTVTVPGLVSLAALRRSREHTC